MLHHRRRSSQHAHLATGLACCLVILQADGLRAAVTTVGAVPNAPPAGGGAVVGSFLIGDSAYGSVTVSGGTAISSTGGAVVGNGGAGIGLVGLSGFGSNWTIGGATSDLILGDEGIGTVSLSSQAVMIVPDDTVIGAFAAASGRLTVSGLGSVFDGGDDIFLGSSGVGIVEISSGGAVQSDTAHWGDGSSARAYVTITGEHSRWSGTLTNIADAGQARLEILTVADTLRREIPMSAFSRGVWV